MRISDWSSDVCSSDLRAADVELRRQLLLRQALAGGVFEQADAIPDRAVQPLEPLARRGRLRRGVAVTRHRPAGGTRSEERRVGKEGVSTGLSRWSPVHLKNKRA